MKKLLFCIFALSLCLSGQAFNTIDPDLQREMSSRTDNEKIKINILLSEQSKPMDLLSKANAFTTKQERRQFVIENLQRQAKTSQADLLALLEEMEHNGMVEDIRPLWLVNCVSCKANKAGHQRLGATARHHDDLPSAKKPNGFLTMRPRLPREAMDAKSRKTCCKSMRRRCGNKAIRAQVF